MDMFDMFSIRWHSEKECNIEDIELFYDSYYVSIFDHWLDDNEYNLLLKPLLVCTSKGDVKDEFLGLLNFYQNLFEKHIVDIEYFNNDTSQEFVRVNDGKFEDLKEKLIFSLHGFSIDILVGELLLYVQTLDDFTIALRFFPNTNNEKKSEVLKMVEENGLFVLN